MNRNVTGKSQKSKNGLAPNKKPPGGAFSWQISTLKVALCPLTCLANLINNGIVVDRNAAILEIENGHQHGLGFCNKLFRQCQAFLKRFQTLSLAFPLPES